MKGAAKIWYDDAHACLWLELPPAEGEHGHAVRLPLAGPWPQALLTILKEREREAGRKSIGKPASPVQYDLDKILAAAGGRVKKAPAKPKEIPTGLTGEEMLKLIGL